MPKMNFVFRTDASKEIGTGHVMRCLTLADDLKSKGNDVTFICREHEGNLNNLIENRGFEVYRLSKPGDNFEPDNDLTHSSWLGDSWNNDFDETKSIIDKLKVKPEWLVIDHYAIDYRWESKIRPFVNNIFVIDDIADRNHDCDLLLDQNLVENMQNRYDEKVPESCRLLLGPEYALLQPIYAELHERIPPREGPAKRILISFGGADNQNITGLVLSAFISLNRPDIEVDVVISESSQYKSKIEKLISNHDTIHLHGSLPTLASLMAKADLAIGACGTTSWERLCLGLPAIVITLAENQNKVGNDLNSMKLIRLIGSINKINKELVYHFIEESINKNNLFEWSSSCMKKCDGNGTKRILKILDP